MTRLNTKIARLNAYKQIVSLIESDIESTKNYIAVCLKNHSEDPEETIYAQIAFDNQEEVRAMENALLEIIELAVSK